MKLHEERLNAYDPFVNHHLFERIGDQTEQHLETVKQLTVNSKQKLENKMDKKMAFCEFFISKIKKSISDSMNHIGPELQGDHEASKVLRIPETSIILGHNT